MKNEKKKVYRLPPCPSYDVEGTESWLEEMEREGLSLGKDGIAFGVAVFERGHRREARYRLATATKGTGMWSDNGGDPDAEEMETGEKYGWEYVAKRGDFHIYRSFDGAARELNTDPEVQAMALKTVEKNRRASFFSLLFWALIWPIIGIRGNLLLLALDAGTFMSLLCVVVVAWMLVDRAAHVAYLSRLRKRLLNGGETAGARRRRRNAAVYHGLNALQAVLIALFIVLALIRWSDDTLDKDKTPLEEFGGSVPFMTMAGLAEGEYELDEFGVPNDVEQRSQLIAPTAIQWREHATIKTADGSVSGGLYVEYVELRWEWLAKIAEKEFLRVDTWGKSHTELETPDVEGCSAAYISYATTNVIIRKGSTVMKVGLYQTGSVKIPLEQWAALAAESIK